jgi:hypothetical protein
MVVEVDVEVVVVGVSVVGVKASEDVEVVIVEVDSGVDVGAWVLVVIVVGTSALAQPAIVMTAATKSAIENPLLLTLNIESPYCYNSTVFISPQYSFDYNLFPFWGKKYLKGKHPAFVQPAP